VIPTPLKTVKFFEQDLFNQLLIPRTKSNNITYKNFHGFSVFLNSVIRDANQINDEVLCSHPQEKSDSYFTFPNENECLYFEKSTFTITGEQEYIEFIQ
jgi:hypothetical protein